ncbi:MAG: Proline dehydrogenase / Delta-1-pyrroline-5-carboxylate dehydrogenase, partial [uncultured Solirubrobacteraceae bacterium]
WPSICRRTHPCCTRRSSGRCWRWSASAESRRRATGWTRRITRSPAGCSPATRMSSPGSWSARRSATSTSTARSPARWSADSPSAATGDPAPEPGPAGPATCSSSRRRARSRKAPCATASCS